ncbi:extracellular solute-binding protein [Agitococcus lubricus]|uniref:Microcin C transport system substrate-binding protein n=1 Tax=Agitococcus lubricus TaxID=1077255 RepID=A0A2T5J1L5_9GAMM|nr:extracellular solute-binding protein [Agitococcus lubricus]PTQ90334.1 microcin C transport system substrate-binding protein [Agitococcus lubricus]
MKRFSLGLLIAILSNYSVAAVEITNAIALHGKPLLSQNFSAFPYANPQAPKGGDLRLSSLGGFDSTNPFIDKGNAIDGTDYLYDSLTVASLDEPFSRYGLLADKIERDTDDASWIIYHINPAAKFSDGVAVTAEDVAFTFNLLKKEGSAGLKNYYRDIDKVEALDKQRVKFSFKVKNNRELGLIVGEQSILPKHFWAKRNFNSTNLDIPLGSGPYILSKIDAGRSITYQRNPNYWGANLAVNKGRYNFNTITYVSYRDTTVALEGFKAGQYDFRRENSAKNWATAYDFPALKQGLVQKYTETDNTPQGMQGFLFNIRRPVFQDIRVRQALAYAFDFEWSNRTLFYNAYTRTNSYFANSELASTGLPSAAELALLEPYRQQLPASVFANAYQAPKTDGSGNLRASLMTAQQLLASAGWTIKNGKLTNNKNERFSFEMLLVQPEFERIVQPFKQNLARLGIDMSIRVIDTPQYINRMRDFDFDMTVGGFPQSLSPGNEQRGFFGSKAADTDSSHNLIGVKNPVVDALIEKIIAASTREQLVTASRALDRVLLAHHYVIPHYHINKYRIAYWNYLEQPKIKAKYSLGLDFWWANSQKLTKVRAAQGVK